jgi:hypothetical protein
VGPQRSEPSLFPEHRRGEPRWTVKYHRWYKSRGLLRARSESATNFSAAISSSVQTRMRRPSGMPVNSSHPRRTGRCSMGKTRRSRKGHVHLDAVSCRQGTQIPQIERVAVGVPVRVLPVKVGPDAGSLFNRRIHRLKLRRNRPKRQGLDQGEVEILGETVIAEVASLQSRSSLERQHLP